MKRKTIEIMRGRCSHKKCKIDGGCPENDVFFGQADWKDSLNYVCYEAFVEATGIKLRPGQAVKVTLGKKWMVPGFKKHVK